MPYGSPGNTCKRSSKDGEKETGGEMDTTKETLEDLQSGEDDELPPEPTMEEGDEQQMLMHTATEVGDGIGDHLHQTSDEDDEGPGPAKRRRTLLVSYQVSPPPISQDSLQLCLGRSRIQLSLVST